MFTVTCKFVYSNGFTSKFKNICIP